MTTTTATTIRILMTPNSKACGGYLRQEVAETPKGVPEIEGFTGWDPLLPWPKGVVIVSRVG